MRLFDIRSNLHGLVVGFFRSLAHCAIRHPRRVLAMAAVVTLVAAPGAAWLKLRTDGHALVTQNAPEVLYDKAIREQFGIEDDIVVLIRSGSADGIFNPGTVQLVRELTAAFMKLPGINPANVMSLATEPSFRFRPGTLVNQTLLEPPLKTKAELDQLRDDLRRIQLYTSTLVSTNGKATVILIGTPSGGDRTRALPAGAGHHSGEAAFGGRGGGDRRAGGRVAAGHSHSRRSGSAQSIPGHEHAGRGELGAGTVAGQLLRMALAHRTAGRAGPGSRGSDDAGDSF